MKNGGGNTIYDTGRQRWRHGEIVSWHPNNNPRRWMLGPCPRCGTATSNYGGGYSCHDFFCPNSSTVFAHRAADPIPDWWNAGIQVKLDGNAWCAHGPDFINLQESEAGFGDTPNEAVKDYRKNLEAAISSPV